MGGHYKLKRGGNKQCKGPGAEEPGKKQKKTLKRVIVAGERGASGPVGSGGDGEPPPPRTWMLVLVEYLLSG